MRQYFIHLQLPVVVLAIAASVAPAVAQPAADDVAIIPQPANLVRTQGFFRLAPDTRIVFEDATLPPARQLGGHLGRSTGYGLALTKTAGGRVIELRIDPALGTLGDEAYKLTVKPDHIEILGAKPVGVFHGVQTLRQLLPAAVFRRAPVRDMTAAPGGGPTIELRDSKGQPATLPVKVELVRPMEWNIPCVEIMDHPRFRWRGAHMDVSRHFMPREFIFKFLDLMALHKLNVFHFHLVDETGWRLEIRKYPRLTSHASGEDYSVIYPDGATRSINQRPGGFYTQDDIREFVAYAAERFITIVPEIELPGHSTAAVLAYPELGNTRQIREAGGTDADLNSRSLNGVYNVDDATIQFLKNVLSEVLELFPSTFIHIGGDEVDKTAWKRNPAAQARMMALGLKNEDELQSWFVRQFDEFLTSRGRRLIGWDEILEGGLAPNAAVMSWRSMDGGIAAARQKHDVVMTPTSHTYFDYYQGKPSQLEPRAIGGHLPLKTVYAFEPVPPQLSEEEARHILGAQFQLWSEFMPHPRHMEYMAYPRGCALAEVAWSPKESRDYESFVKRLRTHLDRLKILDVNYRPLDSGDIKPAASWKAGEMAEAFSVREWDIGAAMDGPGRYSVIFSYTGGAHRLEVEWLELVSDGKVLARVEQRGWAGHSEKDNVYHVTLEGAPQKAILRASVKSDGGTDSNGDIYVLRGDRPAR